MSYVAASAVPLCAVRGSAAHLVRGEGDGAEAGGGVRHEAVGGELAEDEREHRQREEEEGARRDARPS